MFMNKNRLIIFFANIVAAALAAGSAWLPWWNGAMPLSTDSAQLLTSVDLRAPNFWAFSVAMVIFAAAALILLTALTSWKILSFFGVLIAFATLILWFIASRLPLYFAILTSGQIGLGAPIMLAAGLVALLALFIPKHRDFREKLR